MTEESTEPVVVAGPTLVNLDTGSAVSFVSEGSFVRQQLKAYVQGKQMVLTATALREFQGIVANSGGPIEQARAVRFLAKVAIVPDNPSQRALGLRLTRILKRNDIIIIGRGDAMGIVTMSTDRKAIRSARAQGVQFQVYLHQSIPLTGA